MPVPSLSVPELWDAILDCLRDYPYTLKSTALVCSSFSARAQSHLFRKITLPIVIFRGYGEQIVNLEQLSSTQPPKLVAVMTSSPHLIPYVRSLSLRCYEANTVILLARVPWTSIATLAVTDMVPAVFPELLAATQNLIGMPSLRTVSLEGAYQTSWTGTELSPILSQSGVQSITFKYFNISGHTEFVDSESTRQRPRIRELELNNSPEVVQMFNGPASPLNFSNLNRLRIWRSSGTAAFDSFLHRAGATIQELCIHARDELTTTLNLAHLPALTRLECRYFGNSGPATPRLLASAPPSVTAIHLSAGSWDLEDPAFPALALAFEAAILERFPALRTVSLAVRITVHRDRGFIPNRWDSDNAGLVREMEKTLPRLYEKGLLTVYIDRSRETD
ncbi:hypothetical protein C8R46DRAFT_1192589 [Mycena filopes]|nr:hypothetical protein C8R46DRAFT_1192589 [Mycena filopes]